MGPTFELASLTFTPPKDGFAVITGRGSCQVTADSGTGTNQLSIVSDVGSTNGEQGDVLNASSSTVVIGWTTESAIAVTASTPTTVKLQATRLAGTPSGADTCTGTYRVEVFTGTLP